MKLVTVHIPSVSRYILPLSSKYSTQQPVLKDPQSTLSP